MPLPWEAFIPFGLLTVMFAGAGTLLAGTRMLANDGKPPRWSVDNWDEMMMERDRRLTGSKRGQSTQEVAPEEFKTNSVWTAERVRWVTRGIAVPYPNEGVAFQSPTRFRGDLASVYPEPPHMGSTELCTGLYATLRYT